MACLKSGSLTDSMHWIYSQTISSDMSNTDKLNAEVRKLIQTRKTLCMATVTSDGHPEVSVSPFLFRATEKAFYIFISKLATHTNNLLNNHLCSIMLIEDENSAQNIHARTRLTLTCTAQPLDLASHSSEAILDEMEKTLGKTVKLTRQLPDFVLFRLRTSEGRYVKGFGAAYRINHELAVTNLLNGK